MKRVRVSCRALALLPAAFLLGLLVPGALPMAAARAPAAGSGAPTIGYRFTFPEAEHHWMQVEATFSGIDSAPLELRVSRASPGRYAAQDFAKNVYDVEALDAGGRALALVRPDANGWTVPQHASSVTVRYKVFGDRVDGTYLGVDTTHAHINMPAVIMWARGMDDRPLALTFVPPDGQPGVAAAAPAGVPKDAARWQVATQLHAGTTPLEFTAPNLQYLMDSPAEFGPIAMRQFEAGGRTFRFAAHHTGSQAELDALVRDVEKIVRVEGEIFGEFPAYEPGSYTFLADYLPYASGDGMEHRNSTVMTSAGSIRASRRDLLDTVAHEFFHGWNVERIRPRSLEPFDFEDANMSGELWLAEGFTQYYGALAESRARLEDVRSTMATMGGLVQAITVGPGRLVRSAEDMSRMAVFTDGGRPVDRTNWPNTFISYYSMGGALALGLDLSLRERSGGRVSLDDFMRAMWRAYGKPGGVREGYVDRPYTPDDAERTLAEVSGDQVFARDFFARHVHGRDLPDYARLLLPAGFLLRKTAGGRAWWGSFRLDERDGLRVSTTPPANTPAYAAGLDAGDELRAMDGVRVSSNDDVTAVLRRHKPGDAVAVEFVDRTGVARTRRMTLAEDPAVEIVGVEEAGRALTPAQAAFREAWLGQK